MLGIDMKKLCFEENDRLDQTEYTQAALVTVCMAMEKVLRERGLAPDVTAGLSLGDIVRCFSRRHEHRKCNHNSKKTR